jgi:hypothetical protein
MCWFQIWSPFSLPLNTDQGISKFSVKLAPSSMLLWYFSDLCSRAKKKDFRFGISTSNLTSYQSFNQLEWFPKKSFQSALAIVSCQRIYHLVFNLQFTIFNFQVPFSRSIFNFQFSIYKFLLNLSIFNFQFSNFNFQFSIFKFRLAVQFSIYNLQFLIFNFQLSTFHVQLSSSMILTSFTPLISLSEHPHSASPLWSRFRSTLTQLHSSDLAFQAPSLSPPLFDHSFQLKIENRKLKGSNGTCKL